MGCTGSKSNMVIKNGKTYLEVIMDQVIKLNEKYHSRIPLVLMNSFNTEHEAKETGSKYPALEIIHFNQSQFPRIRRDTMLPMPTSPDARPENWYPPGHGDVLDGLRNSGVLDRLLAQGRTHLFISNVDNLGATLDLSILGSMVAHNNDILMEMTPKTHADIKGGTVIEYEGRMKLLETAQVPADKVNEFRTVRKFSVCNTNNIWFDLRMLKTALEEDRMKLDIIVNPKKVGNVSVIQLETAVGSSISCARRPALVCVPRARFLPVKSVADMLVIQSNLYVLDESGVLTMNPLRNFPVPPLVSLGAGIQKIADVQAHFGGVPDMLDLDSLTVTGDVYFGAGCSLKGHVTVVCPPGQRIDLPPGTVLDNKVVTGCLCITDRS